MNQLALSILLIVLILTFQIIEHQEMDFRRKLPFGRMPLWLYVALGLLFFALCGYSLWLAMTEDTLAVLLAWVLAGVMLFDGLGHIAIMIWRRRYFPGTVTAFLLLAGAGFLIATLNAM
jgi:hypothetical protein